MQILYGKYPAELILKKVKDYTASCVVKPCFAIIQVGDYEASSLYIHFKRKKAEEVGINTEIVKFDSLVKLENLIACVESLNFNPLINGIIVQLPLPNHLKRIIEYVTSNKDIDGLTVVQQGNLLLSHEGLFSCTALGIIELLKFYQIKLSGKRIAIIGRSNLVGKPLALLLLNEDAIVSIYHSKVCTDALNKELKNFDIICSAVGIKHLIKGEFINSKSVLIDIGVYKDKYGTYGDLDPSCYEKCEAYTPSIGGVGPMTVACLLNNVIKAHQSQQYK